VAFVEVLYFDHYAAPALAALLILTVEGLRRLRQWAPASHPRAGVWLARTLPVAVGLLAVLDPAAQIARGRYYNLAAGGRDLLEQSLDGDFGPHLILVRYTNLPANESKWAAFPQLEKAPAPVEFVHNFANVDQQQIIWAADLGEEANRRIREYYKGRTVWLYSPGEDPNKLNRLP
jgi:hypothetical protein